MPDTALCYGQEIQDRILYLTRTWAFTVHRQKMKMLGRWPECQQPRLTSPKPSSAPSLNEATLPLQPGHETPTNDNADIASFDISDKQQMFDNASKTLHGISGPKNYLINNLIFAGSTNLHLPSATMPTSTTTTLQPYLVLSDVPTEPTTVHYDQPSEPMPEPSSFNICSNLPPRVDCVEGVCKNLAGHGGGHGVAGCSHGGVAGHQQPESASMSVLPSTILSEQCSQH